jgi:hypothetical protein
MPLSTVDEKIRTQLCGLTDDLRGETVAIAESVGHHVARVLEPKPSQLTHDERGAGRAVGVEVADHDNARPAGMAGDQQLDRGRQATERGHGQQMGEPQIQVLVVLDPARRIYAAQDRVQNRGQALECRG